MYRKHNLRTVLVGVCLWVVRRHFGNRVPTVADYTRQTGLSDDTIRRTARRLLRPICRLLRGLRPGPPAVEGPSAVQRALEAANGFLQALLPQPLATLLASSPARRGVVVHMALHWHKRRVAFEVLAGFLGLSVRTLGRWITRFHKKGRGRGVPHKSRRPHESPKRLPERIQEVLWLLGRLFSSVAEVTQIFNEHFHWLLREEGLERVSSKTVRKYTRGSRPSRRKKKRRSSRHRRGAYNYPPPLRMAWVDATSSR